MQQIVEMWDYEYVDKDQLNTTNWVDQPFYENTIPDEKDVTRDDGKNLNEVVFVDYEKNKPQASPCQEKVYLTSWENYCISLANMNQGCDVRENEYFRILRSLPSTMMSRFIQTVPLTSYLTQNNYTWNKLKNEIERIKFSSTFEEEKFWETIRDYSETGQAIKKYHLFPSNPEKIYSGNLALWRYIRKQVVDYGWNECGYYYLEPTLFDKQYRLKIVDYTKTYTSVMKIVKDGLHLLDTYIFKVVGFYHHRGLTYIVWRMNNF